MLYNAVEVINVKNISPYELSNYDININNLVCFKQNWNALNNSFSYMTLPRPDNGIIFIVDGKAKYSMNNGKIITALPGDILYLPKNSHYLTEFLITPTQTMLINFLLYDSDGNELTLSESVMKLTEHASEFLFDLFNKICDIYPKSSDKLTIKAYFFTLLSSLITQNTEVAFASPVSAAVRYINSHIDDELKISELAKLCAMSESSFRREFIRFTKKSPKKYIIDEKIEKSKQMLSSSEASINEICSVLGFYDAAHFSRLFKSVTGKTPIQYKKYKRR